MGRVWQGILGSFWLYGSARVMGRRVFAVGGLVVFVRGVGRAWGGFGEVLGASMSRYWGVCGP